MESAFKVIVFTAIWGRPEIVKLWAKGVKRIKAYWPEAIDIDVLCIVSTKEDEKLIKELGFSCVWTENKPLGKKHNEGLKALEVKDWDYILQLGSDDLISNDYLHYALYGMQSGYDLFGVDRLYFADYKTKQACKFDLTTQASVLVGAGRFISHKAIKKLNYKIWPDSVNRGLDMTSQANLATVGVSPIKLVTSDYCVCDVKSDTNIWSFDRFARFSEAVDYESLKNDFREL